MEPLNDLFNNNRAWAAKIKGQDPDYFSRMAEALQQPRLLWIGCSDSRVPPSQIVGLPPGEIFVHRNIANTVAHSDLNGLSVIQFAVEVLQVAHIVICGHTVCGGVQAALEDQRYGLIDNWLGHIKDVMRLHDDELAQCPPQERLELLCELNVREQVNNLNATSVVRDARTRDQALTIHGWIYDIRNGLLRDLKVDG